MKSKNNKAQIGVRVECSNQYFKELIDKFYDFKIVMETKYEQYAILDAKIKGMEAELTEMKGDILADMIERGEKNIGIKNLEKIAKTLGTTCAGLLK